MKNIAILRDRVYTYTQSHAYHPYIHQIPRK